MWNDYPYKRRDRTLSFRNRAHPVTLQALRLPQPKNDNRAVARAAIVGDVLLADAEGRAVSFSRRKQFYGPRRRYLGPGGTYAHIMAEVEILTSTGLIVEDRARPGTRGTQSTIRASVALVQAVDALSTGRTFLFHENEPIILRNKLGESLSYPETSQTVGMRKQISEINGAYHNVRLELPHAQKSESHWFVNDTMIRSGPLALRRVFNRGSFNCGGRAYGSW